jgi:two-component system, NarL family, nitrate/nitrite response regulator NarL
MKVLLVDDHALFREGLKLLLKSLHSDLVVAQAGSLEQARREIEDGGPFDLVLLDLHLPGYRRLDALHWMRQFDADLPVVVLSGSEDASVVRGAVEAGAMGFIQKSVDPQAMLQALEQIVAGGVYLPPVCLTSPAGPAVMSHLGISARQAEVLQRLAQGKSNKLIARELGISDTTVKTHVKAVFDALRVHSRTQAVFELARLGWHPAEAD